MQGTASSGEAGLGHSAPSPAVGAPTTVTAASVEHLGAGDLTRAGEAACLLGALRLVDRALAPQDEPADPCQAAANEVAPERLLAAGFAACFLGALKRASGQDGSGLPAGSSVTANVLHIGSGPGAAGLSVELRVRLPDLAWDKAQTLVREAHEACPYSHARRDSVDVRLAA